MDNLVRRCAWVMVCLVAVLPVVVRGQVAGAAAQGTDMDAGSHSPSNLVSHTVRISMSHSAPWLYGKDKDLLQKTLTDAVYEDAVERFGEAAPEEAVFRVYLPKGVRTVRALFLISEHGVGGPMMEHALLHAFADTHQMALVGVLGNPIQRGIYPASVLDRILEELGGKLNHAEFGAVPVFTFGHSNGTGFSALYAALRPDRVIGWISYHSGGSWHLVFPGIEAVPGLIMHGHKDTWIEHGQEQAVKQLRAERNAAVSLLIDGESPHWPHNREATFSFMLAFCEACMRVRFPEGGLTAEAVMKPVAIESGWLAGRYDRAKGGMQKLAIAPYGEFQGDARTANWLPDASFARSWQLYGATGGTLDVGTK